ncbi:MAG: hypothetical protein NZ866_01860, partial [Patescibacteria group bacterium]|nr:hypothetical protein [Patescibacteria group bacterium]
LISDLDLREKDIFSKRLGLEGKKYSLEEIGQNHNLTRERIRQIQNDILEKIQDKLNRHKFLKKEFFKIIKDNLGKIKIKRFQYLKCNFQSKYSLDSQALNILEVFLNIHPDIYVFSENDIYHHLIYINQDDFEKLKKFTKHFLNYFENNKIIVENEFFKFFKKEINNHFNISPKLDEIYEFIKLFKIIAQNPFGEFGLVENWRIVPSSLVDKIKLILDFEKTPLSFYQIYDKLNELSNSEKEFLHPFWKRKYSLKTLHAILNFNNNFVLVGRGIYGLKNWGIEEGKIIDVMKKIVKSNNGLTIENLLEELKKHKIFSKNTFNVYLYQNFKVINKRVYLK